MFVHHHAYYSLFLYFIFKDALPQKKLEEFCETEKKYVNSNKVKAGPMLPETEQLLRDFFTDKNKELADLLNDEKYLWKD